MGYRPRTQHGRHGTGPGATGNSSPFVRPDPAADRERAQQQRVRTEQDRMRTLALELRNVIDEAIILTTAGHPELAHRSVLELISRSQQATADWLDPAYVMGEEILTMVGNRWERGWQPDDLLHYLGRTSPRMDDLGRAAIREQARRSGLQSSMPAAWRRQLDALASGPSPGSGRQGWLFPDDPDPYVPWQRALRLMAELRQLRPLAPVGPPPSAWGKRSRTRPGQVGARNAGNHDPGLLSRVRALLAKAESTNFSAEAEALTAKAQELITRHAIDDALLQAESEGGIVYDIVARRLYVDNPYAVTKATLAHCVAEPNRVRAVWDDHAGSCTLIGLDADLERVELLYTSLLVQATRAMTEEGHGTRTGSVNRSAGFRRSFLLAYANRIGQRLSETAEHVTAEYGQEIVPVLAKQREAVDEQFRALFPSVKQGGTRQVNAYGWRAGTAAADQAVLPKGRLES